MEGLEGLKGLTPQDRADWEKQYADRIQNFSPEQKERAYRNTKFKEKFGSREDYAKLYDSLQPSQRDSLYNEELFKPMETFATDSSSVDSPDYSHVDAEALKQAADESIVYGENYDRIYGRYQTSSRLAEKAVKEFDEVATELSPYYKMYKDTEYLPFSVDEKAQLAAIHKANIATYGQEKADELLRSKMKDTASRNQPILDKIGRGATGAAAQIAGYMVSLYGAMNYTTNALLGQTGDEDFLAGLIDNDITRLGNDITRYGIIFGLDEARKDGMDRQEIITTTAEDEGSILDNLLSINTIPNLIKQQGFTAASMLLSGGMTKVGELGFGVAKQATIGAAKQATVQGLQKSSQILQTIQKAQTGFNAFVVPALSGTIEGMHNALNDKMDYYDEAMDYLANEQNKYIEAELNRRLSDPEALSKAGYNLQKEGEYERLYKDIFDSFAPQYDSAVEKIQDNANKLSMLSFGANSFVNGLGNMTLKAGLQSQGAQEALRRMGMGRLFSSSKFKVSPTGVTSTLNIPKKVLNVVQEPLGEFIEEYSQDVIGDATIGGGMDNISTFIKNKYEGEGTDTLNESFAENLSAALIATGESMVDKKTILSGIYGALSSSMGIPTLGRRRGPKVKMEDESKLDYAKRRSPLKYRNPIWEAIQMQKEESRDRADEAKVIEDWMNEPSNKAKYDGLSGTLNWIKSMNDSGEQGDEFAFRNSTLGKTVNDALMLQKLEGTAFHDSFMNDLATAANLEEGTEEAQKFIDSYRSDLSNRGENLDDSEIVISIKDNANKLLDTMESITKESNELDKLLGNSASEDTKQALIYSKIQMENWRERATTLENEISEVEVKNSTGSTYVSENESKLLIEYGSLKKAKEELDELNQTIKSLEEDITKTNKRTSLSKSKKKEITDAHKNRVKELKKLRKLVSKYHVDISDNEVVLSEKDILSLSPTDRAIILNPQNKSKYSEEQQAIIDNVIKEGTLKYPDFINKVQDAGKINIQQRRFLNQYNQVISRPDSFNAYSNQIKQRVADDNARKKYRYLNEVEDYQTFVKELDKSYREASARDRTIIRNSLKENEHFNKYLEDNKTLEGIFDQLETSDKFKSMEYNDKNILKAAMQYLTDRGVSPTDPASITHLAEVDEAGESSFMKYLSEINSRLPEDNQLTPKELGEIIQSYKDVVNAFANNQREVERVNEPVVVEDVKVEEPKKKEPVSTFRSILGGSDATREVTDDKPPVAAKPKESAFNKENSQEVRDAFNKTKEAVSKSSDIYKDVKEEVSKILDDLGKEVYETPEDYISAIIQKANAAIAETEDANKADKISSLLRRATLDTVDTSEEVDTKGTPVKVENVNSAFISTAKVKYFSSKGDPNKYSLGDAYRDYKIDEYLRTGKVTSKTPVMFMVDPSQVQGVSKSMGSKYNESTDLPIMAIVEDENGPIEADGKRYQPIGFMPSTSTQSEGANRMEPLRRLALSQQDGRILKYKNGESVITNGLIKAVPPKHLNKSDGNSTIQTIMLNTVSEDKAEILNNPNSSPVNRRAIYNEAKQAMLSKMKVSQGKDKQGNPRKKLVFPVSNMKGETYEFEIYDVHPNNTSNRNGTLFGQIIDDFRNNSTNATANAVINTNTKTKKFAYDLNKFTKSNPFKDLNYRLVDGEITYLGDTEKILNEIADRLHKDLTNSIYLPKSFRYKLVPTTEVSGNETVYRLSITDGRLDLPVGKIRNGELSSLDIADIISTIFKSDTGEFRTYNGGTLAKWQLSLDNFEQFLNGTANEQAKRDVNGMFDDNLLESSKNTLNYEIETVRINSPFKVDGTPTGYTPPVVTNKDNAKTNTTSPVITSSDQVKSQEGIVDSETGVIVEKAPKKEAKSLNKMEKVVNQIVEDSKEIKLSEDGKEYVDSNGTRYARVTSIIQADIEAESRFDPNSPWALPSSIIGTTIDTMVRDFFAGEYKDNYPNVTEGYTLKFKEELQGLKNMFDSKGLTIIPRDITVTGTVRVLDSNGKVKYIPVAGTLDLLAYDSSGKFYIFDMKTFRSSIDEKKQAKYSKQLTLYKKFLEDKYGITISSINVIPIKVDYPSPVTSEYSVLATNPEQLMINSKGFSNANPTLKETGSLELKETNLQFSKLTENEKSIIDSHLDANAEVVLAEVVEPSPPVEAETGVKKGKVKRRFGTPKPKTVKPNVGTTWADLTEAQRNLLSKKYTEQEFNSLTEVEKEHEKKCID